MAERYSLAVQEGAKQMTAGGWRSVALADAPVEIIDGDRGKNYPKQDDFLSGGYCLFLNAGNVTADGFHFSTCAFISSDRDRQLGNGKLARRDVVLTTRGTVGNIGYFSESVPHEHVRINSGMVILRASEVGLHHHFLYFVTRSQYFHSQVQALSTGSAQPQLPIRDIKKINIPIPPFPEQRAIAHVLGTLDDKIELNRRMNETLEADGAGAVQVVVRGLRPGARQDGGPLASRRVAARPLRRPTMTLFPDRLIDSELGEIPEGWGVKAFGELLDDVIGGDWGKDSPDPINSEGVSIIRGTDLPNLRNGGIGAVPFRYTTEKKVERRMLQDGDIVIEVSGGSPSQPTGRSMIITRDILARFPAIVVCASFCRRFRPRSWTEGLFAYQHLDYLNSVEKMWEYQLQSTGISNFQTKRFLDEELILWPNDSLTIAFSDLLSPIVRHITNNESKTLAETRDALLPGLVGGEVGV